MTTSGAIMDAIIVNNQSGTNMYGNAYDYEVVNADCIGRDISPKLCSIYLYITANQIVS